MATLRFTGKAKDVANVWTITLDNPHVGSVLTITINGNDFSHTISQTEMDDGDGDEAAGIAAIITNLISEWNAEATPEFAELTASGSTTFVLTMDVAGKPTSVSSSVSSAGAAQDEVQTLSATVTPTSGNYTLTYDGETTSSIAYNANAAAIETALEALSNVAVGDITVAGGPLGTDITFTFDGTGTTEDTNVKTISITDVDLDSSSYTGTLSIANTTHGAAAATTFSASETTAATGRSHWDNGDNWPGGSAPANSDTVIIENTNVPIKYGFAQSAVTLASLIIRDTLPGFQLGLSDLNTDAGTNVDPNVGDVTAYGEFRDRALAISSTLVEIDCDASLIRLDTGSAATTMTVRRTGTPNEGKAVRWVGTSTSNAVYAEGNASIGVAIGAGEAATLDILGASGQSDVECGSGVTWSTATTTVQDQATLQLESNWQTLNQFGGVVVNLGSATGTTLTMKGGKFIQDSTGTLTTLDVENASFDCSKSAKEKTSTNVTLRAGAKFIDPADTHTETNGFDVYGDFGGLNPNVQIIKPTPRTVTYSAV